MTTEDIAFYTGIATIVSGTLYKISEIITRNCTSFKCMECQCNNKKLPNIDVDMTPM